MNIFEMQADLARSWMQLAEAGSKALSEACLNGTQQTMATWQGAAEAVVPKPQPLLPQPFAMFGATPPALAPNPLLSMMFPAAQPAWPFAAMFGMQANPWLPKAFGPVAWGGPAAWGAAWMGSQAAANPWTQFFGANLLGANPFAANPFASNPFVASLFGNPWANNPWMALWQFPGMLSTSGAQPSMVDLITSSYRTASGHAIAAILTPFQQQSAPPAPLWSWPMGGTGRMH